MWAIGRCSGFDELRDDRELTLARIIHERFCCRPVAFQRATGTPPFAAATSLHAASAACRRAGSPLSRSTYCSPVASRPIARRRQWVPRQRVPGTPPSSAAPRRGPIAPLGAMGRSRRNWRGTHCAAVAMGRTQRTVMNNPGYLCRGTLRQDRLDILATGPRKVYARPRAGARDIEIDPREGLRSGTDGGPREEHSGLLSWIDDSRGGGRDVPRRR